MNSVDDFNDIIRSKHKSQFWAAITLSISILGHLSKGQMIGNGLGYFADKLNFPYQFRWTSLMRPQNGGHFNNFKMLNKPSFGINIKRLSQIMPERHFSRWWCRPSLLPYEWNQHLFHDNSKTNYFLGGCPLILADFCGHYWLVDPIDKISADDCPLNQLPVKN